MTKNSYEQTALRYMREYILMRNHSVALCVITNVQQQTVWRLMKGFTPVTSHSAALLTFIQIIDFIWDVKTKNGISLLRENQNHGVEKRAKRFSQLLHFRPREGQQKSKCTLQMLCLIMLPCIANIDKKGKPSVWW